MAEGTEGDPKKFWAVAPPLGRTLAELSGSVEAAVAELLRVSSIEERFPDEHGSIVVITPHPWRWGALGDSDLPRLREARDTVRLWKREGVAVVRATAPEFEEDFTNEIGVLERIVDRSGVGDGPPADTTDRVLRYAQDALQRQRETLRLAGVPLSDDVAGTLLVPDTNGLYANPWLEEWEGTDAATVVIVPQVNRELDRHKNEGGESVRRQKAELVIRQFEEFARRGNTISGVTVRGRLSYREEAIDVDPDPDDHLRVGNDDDRILANVLDLRRRHPAQGVVLVTRDQNLKSKARRHGITCDEPPPPTRQFKPRRPKRPNPEVMLGHPGGQISTTPLHELKDCEKSELVSLIPHYTIENKGTTSVSDVTTGLRTRDGRTHSFEAYRAQLLGAGETSHVRNVGSIPREFLKGVHESEGFDAFLYWAHCTDRDGVRWEALYDAASRTTTWAEVDREADTDQ
jgi:hypothetical protein